MQVKSILNPGKPLLGQNSVGLHNDFTNALGQQLFFWGCDVVHPSGNLLCRYGLERHKDPRVEGTSCYRTNYKSDIIELHGWCVGRYSRDNPSFLYTRKHAKCWVYNDSKPPLPGLYEKNLIQKDSFQQIDEL